MNIFYLDKDPVLAAQYHCDKHVVKMTLETAQILCAAQNKALTFKESEDRGLYKSTHKHYPSTLWAQQREKNYEWTYKLFEALLTEYKFRFNKTHASSFLCDALRQTPQIVQPYMSVKFFPPSVAMPEEFYLSNGRKPVKERALVSSLHSYRNYYANGKKHLLTYTKRDVPDWVEDYQKSWEKQRKELFLTAPGLPTPNLAQGSI